MTVTSGRGRNPFNRSVIRLSKSVAVLPAAASSPINGSEIFPSGRTGTVRLSSGSLQTLMSTTSFAPIRYSSPVPTFGWDASFVTFRLATLTCESEIAVVDLVWGRAHVTVKHEIKTLQTNTFENIRRFIFYLR